MVENEYIHYIEGNAPIVITAPHGGLEDFNMIDRKPIDTFDQKNVRKVCTENDFNTYQLAINVHE